MFRADAALQGFENLLSGELPFAIVLHQDTPILLRWSLAGISADKLHVLLSGKVSLHFAKARKDVHVY